MSGGSVERGFLEALANLGLPAHLCEVDTTMADVRAHGDLCTYLVVSAAESFLPESLPEALLEAVFTLGDLVAFVDVRRAHHVA